MKILFLLSLIFLGQQANCQDANFTFINCDSIILDSNSYLKSKNNNLYDLFFKTDIKVSKLLKDDTIKITALGKNQMKDGQPTFWFSSIGESEKGEVWFCNFTITESGEYGQELPTCIMGQYYIKNGILTITRTSPMQFNSFKKKYKFKIVQTGEFCYDLIRK